VVHRHRYKLYPPLTVTVRFIRKSQKKPPESLTKKRGLHIGPASDRRSILFCESVKNSNIQTLRHGFRFVKKKLFRPIGTDPHMSTISLAAVKGSPLQKTRTFW